MKATFPLVPLRDAVKAACNVVPSRTTMDILRNIKFTVSGEIAKLAATDSENSIVAHVRGVECLHSGEFLLPAAKMLAILGEIRGETVTMDCDNGKVTIKSGGAKFVIQTGNPADFPPSFEFAEENYFTVSGQSLSRMLRRTMFVCDETGSKSFALNGICLEYDLAKLTIISTDTRRLSIDSCDSSHTPGCDPVAHKDMVLIPKKGLPCLASNIGVEPVDIAVTQNSVIFRTGDIALCCMRGTGRFPDFRRAVWEPASRQHSIDIPVGQFNAALRQAILTTAEESRAIEFAFKNGTMTLRARAADVGESEIEMPISFDGDVSVRMDPNYTLQATKMMDQAQSFTMEINDGVWMLRNPDGWRYIQMEIVLKKAAQ